MNRESKQKTWLTLFDPEYSSDLFLYHYTSFKNACKILYSNSLKFSSLSNTNDTNESKAKIIAKEIRDKNIIKDAVLSFERINKSRMRLLCFSQDNSGEKEKHLLKMSTNCFDDYTGRGFALPRMWAQYANNHSGVCFIIDTDKLNHVITRNRTLLPKIIIRDRVKYTNHFAAFEIKHSELEYVQRLFSSNDSILHYDYLKNTPSFLEYNYFQKNIDWQQENEYRILAYSTDELYLNGFSEYCVGMVVGEMTDECEMKILNSLTDNRFLIYQIKFELGECRLKKIDFRGFDQYA